MYLFKKFKYILITILMLMSCSVSNSQVDIDVEHYMELLNAKNYDELFDEILDLQEQEYGLNCFTDYLLAKCLCSSDEKIHGIEHFSKILRVYDLTIEDIEFMVSEKAQCSIDDQYISYRPSTFEMFSYLTSLNNPESSSRGKLGYANCNKKPDFIKVVRNIPDSVFNNRLFEISKTDAAVAQIQSLVGNEYMVATSGRYIVVTKQSMGFSDTKIKTATDNLEKVYDFYSDYFKIRPPHKLITVYLMPNRESLINIANMIHGIELPETYIGYSCIRDLSIAGIGNNPNGIGTLKHELFHLMIRTDMGDIPAWLDEGLACLYETSVWDKELLIGETKNWRTHVLNDFSHFFEEKRVPTIRELIGYNWPEFEGSIDNRYCEGSFNYALAKHFMIYVQGKKQLQPLVSNFKNRNAYLKDTIQLPKTDIQLVEDALGSSMDEIEKEFYQWLENTYYIDLTINTDTYDADAGTESISISTIQIKLDLLLVPINELQQKIDEGEIPKKRPVYNSAVGLISDYNEANEKFNIKLKEYESNRVEANMDIQQSIPRTMLISEKKFQEELITLEKILNEIEVNLKNVNKNYN